MLMSPYILYKKNSFETNQYTGLKFSEITEINMLFQYSEILFC